MLLTFGLVELFCMYSITVPFAENKVLVVFAITDDVVIKTLSFAIANVPNNAADTIPKPKIGKTINSLSVVALMIKELYANIPKKINRPKSIFLL